MLRTWPNANLCTLLLLAALAGCASTPPGGARAVDRHPRTYVVSRLSEPMTIDADWDKPAWKHVPPLELTQFMGERPEHFPRTQARLVYDDEAIYVIFRVEDRYVRAVAQKHHDAVCRDSCVEFFFTPGDDTAAGYFNMEMNCGGTTYFDFQVIPRKNAIPIAPADLERVRIAHVLPKIVEPEIAGPTTWTVEYRIPFDILPRYYPGAKKPAPGVTWRANFYKCGDDTSHPHWLTWSYVDRPKPDFHVPSSFGTLRFE
ncbi:MAG TPA: carbohydrate-binding family 9-like protein [Phycisphaerae bacterium]|nr:carbohydrate-binding family 9-like protein [Phycisphaerae bacterium]